MRDPAVTRKIMSSIPSKNTKPEVALRKALWKENYRYRVNYKNLPGRPDIVFTKARVVVFCDGDFWHGHNWVIRGMNSFDEELDGYSEYWRRKIKRNVERDRETDLRLRALGWTVVRIWESDIKKDLDACVRAVKEAIFEVKLRDKEDILLEDKI